MTVLVSVYIFIFRKISKFLNLRNKPPCYIYYSDTFYLTFGVFCSCNDYFGISVLYCEERRDFTLQSFFTAYVVA